MRSVCFPGEAANRCLAKHLEEPPRFHTSKENLVISQDRLLHKDECGILCCDEQLTINGPLNRFKLKPPLADEGYRMTAVAIHLSPTRTDLGRDRLAQNDTDAYKPGPDYRTMGFFTLTLHCQRLVKATEVNSDPIAEFEQLNLGKQDRVGPQLRVSKDKATT